MEVFRAIPSLPMVPCHGVSSQQPSGVRTHTLAVLRPLRFQGCLFIWWDTAHPDWYIVAHNPSKTGPAALFPKIWLAHRGKHLGACRFPGCSWTPLRPAHKS